MGYTYSLTGDGVCYASSLIGVYDLPVWTDIWGPYMRVEYIWLYDVHVSERNMADSMKSVQRRTNARENSDTFESGGCVQYLKSFKVNPLSYPNKIGKDKEYIANIYFYIYSSVKIHVILTSTE